MSKETTTRMVRCVDVVGQLRELLSKATPGPWHFSDHVGDGTTVALIGNTFIAGPPRMAVIDETHDCAAIVAAINALPALLAIAEAAEEACDDGPFVDDNCPMARLRTALSLLPNHQRSPATRQETPNEQ